MPVRVIVHPWRGLCVAGVLVGCVRTFDVMPDMVDSDVNNDGIGDTSAADDTDTAPPVETDESPQTVCIPGEAPNFRLPDARWGLAVLFASRRYGDLYDSELSLSPEWFLASAWERTGFGCTEYGDPWTVQSRWQADEGCTGLAESTAWADLCRLFPDTFECSAYSGMMSGDHIEAGVMALGWYMYTSHALLQMHDVAPDPWYVKATDPQAMESMSALMHYAGAWYPIVGDLLADCPDDVAGCLTSYERDHVDGVLEKLGWFEQGSCYQEPLTSDDVQIFTEEMARLWPDRDWQAAAAAAEAELAGGSFEVEALAVIEAIEAVVDVRMWCPESELYSWFALSCP